MTSKHTVLDRESLGSGQVLLLLRGSRRRPGCGCSSDMVDLLDELGADYAEADMEDSEARAFARRRFGISEYPQLVVDSRPIGGLSDVKRALARGELDLGADTRPGPLSRPVLRITLVARTALIRAAPRSGIRIDIATDGSASLEVGLARPEDVTLDHSDFSVAMDVLDALRLSEVEIDYVDPPGGLAVHLCARVRAINKNDLEERLGAGAGVEIVDARCARTRSEAPIVGARVLSGELVACLRRLRPLPLTVVVGDSDTEGRRQAQHLAAEGLLRVCWLRQKWAG